MLIGWTIEIHKNTTFYFIIVGVSVSTEAFVGTVCLRPETERRKAIRQTVPTKASVEAETSTMTK